MYLWLVKTTESRVCTWMRKNVLNLKSSPVYSWSHGGRRIHIHTLMLILCGRLSLYMYPMEFWSSFCIEKIKHVFMCVVVDVLHVLSIVCMRWKYFRSKIQCFHCHFGEIVQYQKKDDFKQMANVFFFIVQFSLACQTKPNTKCMYGENIQIDELMLIYGLVRCTDEMIGPMNKTSYLNPVGHLTPIKKYCLWPFISSRETEKKRIQHLKWKCCLKHKCFVDCGSGNQILLEKAVHIHMRKGSENPNES